MCQWGNFMHLFTIEQPQQQQILRQIAQPVQFPLDEKTKNFIQQFFTFFLNLKGPTGQPAGLAAPQVGHSWRIIIVQVSPEAKKIRKDVFDILPPTLLINPTYTPLTEKGKNKDWEGCFSVNDKMGEVYRYTEIQYQAFTLEGKKITGIAKGLLARIIQHEVDHLNGQLFVDVHCSDCRLGGVDEMMKIRKKEMGLPENNQA